MKKFLTCWFEGVKAAMFILIGLIPAFVFKIYAPEQATYDALYSIIIWALLILAELGQIALTSYIQKTDETKEENNEEQTQRRAILWSGQGENQVNESPVELGELQTAQDLYEGAFLDTRQEGYSQGTKTMDGQQHS